MKMCVLLLLCVCEIFKSYIHVLICFITSVENINQIQPGYVLLQQPLQCSTAVIHLVYVSSAGDERRVEVNSLKCVTVIMSSA